MQRFFHEFVQFASRGNLMGIVAALILGAAFSRIVTSLVGDILLPPIYAFFGMPDLDELQYVMQADPEVVIRYGRLLSTLLDFVIVAFCLYLALRCAMRWQSKSAPPATSGKTELLTQIRDGLKSKRKDCDSAEQPCAASLSEHTEEIDGGEKSASEQ